MYLSIDCKLSLRLNKYVKQMKIIEKLLEVFYHEQQEKLCRQAKNKEK